MSKIQLAAEIVAYLVVAALLGFVFAWMLRGALQRAKAAQPDADSKLSDAHELLTQQLAARDAEIAALSQRLAALEQSPHSAAAQPLPAQNYGEIPRFLEQLRVGAPRAAPRPAPSDYDGISGNLFEEEALSAPRTNLQRDDLKKVHGIGPRFERMLNELGIHTYKQIALWRDEDVTRYARELHTFPDRVRRDEWVRSAREQHLLKYGERL